MRYEEALSMRKDGQYIYRTNEKYVKYYPGDEVPDIYKGASDWKIGN
ncbi:hypothetical protein EVB61_140 [Rhizobium phage RHph_TM21B]|nr:hypothetical protein EVB61_140 [Rhizobium phage RHph_TM21B]